MRRTARVLPWFAAFLLPGQPSPQEFPEKAEFHFVRLEYTDGAWARRGWGGRGWWMQDWPEAEMHFAQGIQRITRIHIGDNRHMPLSDNRIYDHPWIYATQTGFWDLSDAETRRLGDYLERGGFLVADDFYGPRDWEVFQQTMARVLPGRPILDLEDKAQFLSVLFDIKERTFDSLNAKDNFAFERRLKYR